MYLTMSDRGLLTMMPTELAILEKIYALNLFEIEHGSLCITVKFHHKLLVSSHSAEGLLLL